MNVQNAIITPILLVRCERQVELYLKYLMCKHKNSLQ
ncbi:UNVERIFIED_CONTAM: hypothetical protein GTU68_027569 [Idotea baltica]|nr:hypothetical protein [Idotea baltica]